MSGCPEFPTNIIAPGRRAARGLDPVLRCLRRADARPTSSGASASADRHLREAGVTYRAPGETADRLWPLSHLPLLIDEADWQQLTAGIVQRAQLLELVLSDLYGEGRLVAEGAIPAAAIAGSTEYLRAVCGIKPPGGRYLRSVCRRCRPRARWALVGAGRPHPGAVGRGLRAGKPAGAVARLHLALQVDECRAGGAVLRGVPRCLARQRRPRRAAHRTADARAASAKPISNTPRWRAISASCWSRATISPSAATAFISAPSPA